MGALREPRGDIALPDPVTFEERAAAAEACALRLQTSVPILLDAVDDAVALAYGGWPDRLYLIGRDGRVAFQGGARPSGFKPEEPACAVEDELELLRPLDSVVHRRPPQEQPPGELLDPPPEAHQSKR